MKTAVIYARFSSTNQREASIADQLRECRAWCEREQYKVVAEYSDSAISGRTDNRPEFQHMISNAGESDIVLVYMMDRFSRDAFDAPIYKSVLAKRGVKLVSATETIPEGPEGIILEKILEGLAAFESAQIGIRTKRGMEGNALQCRTNGVRIYGYTKDENDHYIINEQEALFVKEAFRRRIDNESIDSIAKDFASRGVKTFRGLPCNYNMIYRLLRDRRYTGLYIWGDVVKQGGIPQIIDEISFSLCQDVKSKKIRENENWSEYILSGRIICGNCGRKMSGRSGRGQAGKKYEYYGCAHCELKSVRVDLLEGQIVARLREILSDTQEAYRIADFVLQVKSDKSFNNDKKALQKQINDADLQVFFLR